MTRLNSAFYCAALIVLTAALAFAAGTDFGANRVHQQYAVAVREADAAIRRSEQTRLEAQSARDRLAQELEDAAHADPVASPACLSTYRVRRLNALRD